MEMIDNNINEATTTGNKPELFAAWIASFASAFACFGALPLGLRAGWELDLTPMALACVLAGSWLLGIAVGGYASLFWKRMLTPKGRAMMLIVAAWAAGGLASIDSGAEFLILLGIVGMISAATFASQFRPRATVQVVLASTVWALAGICAALLLLPSMYDLLSRMLIGPTGAWRMSLVAPAALLVAAAIVGYQLTKPRTEAESTAETEPSMDVSENAAMPAGMAAAA